MLGYNIYAKQVKNPIRQLKRQIYLLAHYLQHYRIIFLICGRRRDRIKALFRESDGFVLVYKRFTVPGGYQWPRKQSEVRNLSWREFDWLMSGIDIDQPKALKAE